MERAGCSFMRRWLPATVVIFVCVGSAPARAQSLVLHRSYHSPTSAPGDRFGAAIASVGDMHRLLVGAPDDSSAASGSGQAFLFDPAAGDVLAVYPNPAPGAGDAFGSAAASVGGFWPNYDNAQIVIGARAMTVPRRMTVACVCSMRCRARCSSRSTIPAARRGSGSGRA
jgi:hypothetical protein